jgi:hypothetical protein
LCKRDVLPLSLSVACGDGRKRANLSTVAPDEFVVARDALVKALRHDKRRDEAAEVAALRRPSPVDWALNCVATESAELIAKALAMVTALRDAQATAFDEGGRSDRLRDAVGEGRSVAVGQRVALREFCVVLGDQKSGNAQGTQRTTSGMGLAGLEDADIVQGRVAHRVDDEFRPTGHSVTQ